LEAWIHLNIDEKVGGKVSGKGGQVTSEPIKARLFEWLRDNPNVRGRGYLKRAARGIKLDYESNKELLWKYASEYRTSLYSLPLNGRGSNLADCPIPDAQHAVYAECQAPECLDRVRYPEVTDLALEAGWKSSRNGNRELYWDLPWGKDGLRLGRIRWWETGTIKVHVLPPQTIARAKQLLYSAFVSTGLILDRDICDNFLDSVDWDSSHDVYFYDKPLPYKKITSYAVLGVTKIVTGDNSHKRGLEVEVCKPKIVKNYEKLVSGLSKLIEHQDERSNTKDAQIEKLIEMHMQAIQRYDETIAELTQAPKTKRPERLYES
jgi:hypothetical protein